MTAATPPDHSDASDASDVFATAALRARVLDAWAASPARLREDANAEEDLALGGHRDRLVVELAQNAADAAARAGVPGRLLLSLRDGVLVAANSGAPLDAAGVEACSTLRASAKRSDDESVGRFGVGFAAVVAVCDEPWIVSRSGSVRWSRAETYAAVAGVASLAAELAHRGGHVPVLRLPFPGGSVPESYDTALYDSASYDTASYDTAVVLPLRDAATAATVAELLDLVDAALLLTLPALAEVVVENGTARRVLTASWQGDTVVVSERAGALAAAGDTGSARTTAWRLRRTTGRHPAQLLADRPTEERARTGWSLTWAVPVDADGSPQALPPTTPPVVHAPTVTDEPLGLPALLIASFPLDPTRRRVAPGPARDALVAEAGRAYADLVASLPLSPRLLELVPAPLAASPLDADLRRAATAALGQRAWLPTAGGPARRLRPRDAVAVPAADDAAVTALAAVVDGLLPAAWARRRAALQALGARELTVADVVDALPAGHRTPQQWRELYDALAGVPREELGALPVPLADGRLVRGPRGLVLPGSGLPRGLDVLGLRVVHPDAAHPLLERLGATPATPRLLLDDPALRAAVGAADASDDPDPAVAEAVLALVDAAGTTAADHPWLADVLLSDETGGVAPARALVLPGGPAEQLLDAAEVARPAPELISRWGTDVLAAVGVLDGLRLVRAAGAVPLDDSVLDDPVLGELADIDSWAAAVGGDAPLPPVADELVGVADLDLVVDDAWPDALRHLGGDRDLRAAVVEPVRLVDSEGRRSEAVSYTAWWLGRHALISGRPPSSLRDADGDPLLAGLWPEAPALGLDPALLRAVGVRTTLADVLATGSGPDELLDRLADAGVTVERARLRQIYRALADVDPDRVSPPERVRVAHGAGSVVRDAAAVVVVDAPDLLPLAGAGALPAAQGHAARLAEVLDLPLASEVFVASVRSVGTTRAVPEAVRTLLPGAPPSWVEHEVVVVGADGIELDWRVESGIVHAATVDGLARGLAWVSGAWSLRGDVAAVLADPDADPAVIETLLAEAELG